jgi:hypothetical protein
MAVALPAVLFQHEVTIEPFQGNGANGPVYGAPVTVRCFRDDKRRLVRAPNGSQVVSESTVYCLPGTVAPPESRINLGSRVATVITSADRDGGTLPVPSHVEVNCT